MAEFLRTPEQPALISEREVLDGLGKDELRAMKAFALEGISDRERVVNLVNDILDNGYADEANLNWTGFYDANDGTLGSAEHEDDSRWVERARE